MRGRKISYACVLFAQSAAAPALAADESAEFWLTPTITTKLDSDTEIRAEFSYRTREEENVRGETLFGRVWIRQDLTDALKISAAIERRENEGANETRFIQQIALRKGWLAARLRFEQRDTEEAQRLGLRFRPLIGVAHRFGSGQRWEAHATVELQWTLQGQDNSAEQGLTAYRTDVGASYRLRHDLQLGLSYLRQRSFRSQREDQILHVPAVNINLII